MRALVYLLGMRIKNRLLSLLKNPGSLIMIVVMAALLVMVVTSGNMAHTGEALRDPQELYAIVLVFLCWIFLQVAKNGLGKGTSLFTMADINLVFTSPVSSRRILLYGLTQQLGTSLLMGFFLLFQYAWMRNVYGIGLAFVVALMVCYGLTVFCAQLTAMAIYVYTSGNDRRKRTMLIVMVAVTAAAVMYLLYHAYVGKENLLGSVVAAANGLPLSLFPVAGWARELSVSVSTGSWGMAAAMLAVIGGYIALLTWIITASQSDYYEDVLQSTERSFSAVVAAKSGKPTEALPSNIKVGSTGIGKGWGASTFFYKQRLENRRARRFLLDTMSLIMLVVTLVYAYFMKDTGLLSILIFATYMQFFSISNGRWTRELLYPYVYLAPGSAFRKLIYNLLEMIEKLAVESVLMAVGVMLILELSPVEAVAFAIARFSFGMVFVGGLLVVERLFTSVTLKWLVMVLMLFVELLMVIPGIALAVWISIAFPQFLTANLRMLLLPAAANLVVALAAIYASRNVLKIAELNNA